MESFHRPPFLQFMLVLPVSGGQPALPRIDRAIVGDAGADSSACPRACRGGPTSEKSLTELMFPTDSTKPADSTRVAAADTSTPGPPGCVHFGSAISQRNIEGTFLVATEDEGDGQIRLALPDVQRTPFPQA